MRLIDTPRETSPMIAGIETCTNCGGTWIVAGEPRRNALCACCATPPQFPDGVAIRLVSFDNLPVAA